MNSKVIAESKNVVRAAKREKQRGRGLGPGRLRREKEDGRTVWVAHYTDAAGKRRRIQVGHDAKTARQVFAKTIRERDLALAGMSHETHENVSLERVTSLYLDHLAGRRRQRAVVEARSVLQNITRDLGLVHVSDITKPALVEWRQRESKRGLSNKRINTKLSPLNAALNFALSIDLIPTNPLAGLSKLDVSLANQRRLARALTEEELVRLVAAGDAVDATNAARRAAAKSIANPSCRKSVKVRTRTPRIPQTPLLVFLVATGARWGEAVATRWDDIAHDGSAITLRGETTKTLQTRTLPLHADVVARLEVLRALATRDGNPLDPASRIFLTPEGRPWETRSEKASKPNCTANFRRRFLTPAMERARIPHRDQTGRVVHVHAMRHTFGTRCARAGIPITTTQRLLGHATIDMTANVYTHVTAADARLAIASLPPLPSTALAVAGAPA